MAKGAFRAEIGQGHRSTVVPFAINVLNAGKGFSLGEDELVGLTLEFVAGAIAFSQGADGADESHVAVLSLKIREMEWLPSGTF
jgi:hypothetical protein